MGVADSPGSHRSQQNSLLVVDRHMPDEALVDGRISTDPRRFALVGGKQRSGPKQQYPPIAANLHIRRKVRPSNPRRSEGERRSQANSG
jgi:hypothetical protein